MTQSSYKQFCPVAMAAEVLCTRWTMLILREMVAGSTRFNDLRRGVPRMSPALLSKRLRELEAAGVIRRVELQASSGILEYQLTRAGKEVEKVVESVGFWGQSCVDAHDSLKNLDPSLLMWDMRRNLDPTPMPKRRCVLLFVYPELPPARRNWWLVIEPKSDVDLCSVDPGFDIDLYVTVDLRTMTAIWMGITTVQEAANNGKVSLIGDQLLAAQMQAWLRLSPFAKGKSRLSA